MQFSLNHWDLLRIKDVANLMYLKAQKEWILESGSMTFS